MTQPSAPLVLSARGIRKSFAGVEVLHGVDLEAASGRVLALLGENGAGKSTLVKVISGDYQPDAGSLDFGEDVRDRLTPIAARALGVRMIYQELNDAPPLSVAENIFLGRLPRRRGFVRWGEMRRAAREILADLEVDIDPLAPMSTLGVGERQVIEIARALTDQARLLILDEPTAALSGDETDRLFEFIARLRRRGTAMIYITHRLDELQRVADDVVVLRDGRVVLSDRVGNTSRSQLVEAMVGDWVGDVTRPSSLASPTEDPPTLSVRGASHARSFRDIDLDLHTGEVVALYGKLGSGTAEVVEAFYGLRRLDAGTFRLATDERSGERAPRGPREAIRRGLGFLPADRKQAGALLPLSCAQNLAAPSWPTMTSRGGIVLRSQERKAFDRWRERLMIRSAAGGDRPIATLSGGNQQKVLLARWLHARSRVLMLVEPTRGVDVGARQEIYRALRTLAADGVAVLVATSDYEEVVQLADRAVVMAGGRVTRELATDEISVANLTDAAAG